MLVTNRMAKYNLQDYGNKNNKISRDIKNGKLFKIKTGLYETNPNTPGYLLASSIYGPSYISFEYALSYHGMIPERVSTVTCATFGKRKRKKYNTSFGTFTYRDVPKDAYYAEIELFEEDNYVFQMATPEKALCDKLYTLSPLNNYTNLEIMLFEDLRIDEEEFANLNKETIENLSKLYHCTNVTLLAKYMRRINE